jgi:hypothetical protein
MTETMVLPMPDIHDEPRRRRNSDRLPGFWYQTLIRP